MIPLDLTWCERGEVIEVANLAGHPEPQMVMTACDGATRMYHCVVCHTAIANIGNLVMHIDRGGAHRIASWCPRHRTYEACERSQREAFAQVTTAAP